MLKAGAQQSTKWPKMKTDKKEQQPSPSSSSHRDGSDESDNEDKIPVPEFHSSFGSAIEAALENIGSKNGKMESLWNISNWQDQTVHVHGDQIIHVLAFI